MNPFDGLPAWRRDDPGRPAMILCHPQPARLGQERTREVRWHVAGRDHGTAGDGAVRRELRAVNTVIHQMHLPQTIRVMEAWVFAFKSTDAWATAGWTTRKA